MQYGIGNLLPFVMLLIPGVTVRRAAAASILVLFGVLMMRWNVVIGGQAFSLTFDGFMHYHLPIIVITSYSIHYTKLYDCRGRCCKASARR